MSDHKLEDKFREKLDGYVSPIDADALWNDMQPDERKKYPLWWFFLSFALITVAGLFLHTTFTKGQEDKISEANELSIIENRTTKKDHKTVEVTPTNNDFNVNAENELKQKSTSNTKIVKSETESISQKRNNNTKDLNRRSVTNEFQSNNTTTNKIENQNTFRTKSIPNENNIQDSNLNINSNLESSHSGSSPLGPMEENAKLKNEILENDKNVEKKDDKESKELVLNMASKIESSKLTQFEFSIEEPTYKPNWINKVNLNKNDLPKLQIGAYYSYEYANRNLEAKDSIPNFGEIKYTDVRNASESFVESFRTGLLLRKTFKKGFRLSGGIEYAKLTERFDAAIDLGVRLVEDPIDFTEPTLVQQTNIKKIFNRYETLNIPITLGKEFSSNKWRFYLDAGIGLNLNFKTKGQIFSSAEAFEVQEFSNDDQSIFKSRLGISYMASAGVRYYFKRDLSIELGPHWQSTFGSMNTENYRLETRHQYYGIKIALIKNL